MTEVHEMVKSLSIEGLVQCRTGVVEKVQQAMHLLDEAARMAAAGHTGFPRVSFVVGSGVEHGVGEAAQQAVLRHVDAGAWAYLMRESGMLTLMDAQARSDWNEKIYSDEVPPLTRGTIAETFQAMHDDRQEIFERGVINVFHQLSWNYKTNSPVAFGKKIIVEGLCQFTHGMAWFNHDRCNALDDLSRIGHLLMGVPEPDHRSSWNARLSSRTPRTSDGVLEVQWYKKGTGHVTFVHPDLPAKMNAILAKHFPNALARPA